MSTAKAGVKAAVMAAVSLSLILCFAWVVFAKGKGQMYKSHGKYSDGRKGAGHIGAP